MIRVILSQDVEPSSPAALAGLQPYTDYVVGSDQILQEVECMFFPVGSDCLCACQVLVVGFGFCINLIKHLGVVLGDFGRSMFMTEALLLR